MLSVFQLFVLTALTCRMERPHGSVSALCLAQSRSVSVFCTQAALKLERMARCGRHPLSEVRGLRIRLGSAAKPVHARVRHGTAVVVAVCLGLVLRGGTMVRLVPCCGPLQVESSFLCREGAPQHRNQTAKSRPKKSEVQGPRRRLLP